MLNHSRLSPRHVTPVLLTIVLLSTVLTLSQSAPVQAQDPWVLVWSDEFSGSSIDTTKWNVLDVPGSINNELHYISPNNIAVQNGELVIRADRESVGGREYTSGKVTTNDKFEMLYGRVEIRAKMPAGQGLHSAHWLLQHQCKGWNGCATWPPEFDIMEMLGHEPTKVYQSVHYGRKYRSRYPSNASSTTPITITGVDFSQSYNVFAIEWEPGVARWYVNGVLKKTFTDSRVSDELMYIILDIAVGGNWPGSPDATTMFPAYHYIDYVRVYQRQSQVTPTITPGGPTATFTPTFTPTVPPSGSLIPAVAAVASSRDTQANDAVNAIDGNLTTRWSSQYSEPQWIYVDLGSARDVSTVVLRWEAAYGRNYDIQVSTNATFWTTIRSVTNSDGGVDEITGLSANARYVRMYGTIRASGWGFSLWEFEVYGGSGTAPTSTPVFNPPTNTPATPTNTPVFNPPTNTPVVATNTPGGSTTNLALNKTTTVSSQNAANQSGVYAVDGNTSTSWRTLKRSNLTSEWIIVDLGVSTSISRVVLRWGTSFYATVYSIDVSADNVNWTTVYSTSTGNGSVDDFSFATTSARYVRFNSTGWENNTERNWLYEFEIYQ
jgi:beta-glucanase (GH16 family)